jgi:hypothetical protein
MRKSVWWLVGILVLASAGVLLYSWRANRPAPRPPVQAAAPKPPVTTPPPVQNPVPSSQSPAAAPLPSLADSDPAMRDALGGLVSEAAFMQLFRPDMLVRHTVVTIDNLSRKRAAEQLRPIKPVPGQFIVNGNDQQATIDPNNYKRYDAYMKVLQMVDVKQVAALYFRFYPLFQQAYQNLGYPNGYFNDRLVETIDNLLETPDVSGPVQLVRPNVMYQYADPMLEKLSAGQKLLIRIGPQNEAIVKAKLRELRAAVADRSRGADSGSRERNGSGT